MTSPASIPPVVCQVEVKGDAQTAFDAFTTHVARWWPFAKHSISFHQTGQPAKSCSFEPKVGGHLFEIMANGERRNWGEILRWEPGEHLSFTWHVSTGPELATQVDIQFEQAARGSTRVTLTHSNWERLGENAAKSREDYNGGWRSVLGDHYVPFLEP